MFECLKVWNNCKDWIFEYTHFVTCLNVSMFDLLNVWFDEGKPKMWAMVRARAKRPRACLGECSNSQTLTHSNFQTCRPSTIQSEQRNKQKSKTIVRITFILSNSATSLNACMFEMLKQTHKVTFECLNAWVFEMLECLFYIYCILGVWCAFHNIWIQALNEPSIQTFEHFKHSEIQWLKDLAFCETTDP